MCSMVIVRATISNGIAPGDPIDVEVEIPPASGTTSLAGGRLLTTELTPVMMTAQGQKAGKTIALAGGPVMTGKPGDPANLKVGRVLGGAHVKTEIPYNLIVKDERRSARTTKLVEDVIKLRFHQSDGLDQKSMAVAKTDTLLILKVPKVYHRNQGRYFQVIQNLSVVENPTLRAQRMEIWGKQLLDPKMAGISALRLEGLGSNAVPTLKGGLASPDLQVRFFAAESLAYLGQIDGADALAEVATKRPEFRAYALKALAAMDQSAGLMRLRALMAQPDVELRYGAFDALRSFDPTDPFLGQVATVEEPPADENLNDALALRIGPDRRRRPAGRDEPAPPPPPPVRPAWRARTCRATTPEPPRQSRQGGWRPNQIPRPCGEDRRFPSPPRQNLPEQHAQHRRRRRQPARDHRLAQLLARHRVGCGAAMPEQSHHLAQRQGPRRRALDQREERSQFLLRCDQSLKARTQHDTLARHAHGRLAPRGIGTAHADTTGPLLSRLSVYDRSPL